MLQQQTERLFSGELCAKASCGFQFFPSRGSTACATLRACSERSDVMILALGCPIDHTIDNAPRRVP